MTIFDRLVLYGLYFVIFCLLVLKIITNLREIYKQKRTLTKMTLSSNHYIFHAFPTLTNYIRGRNIAIMATFKVSGTVHIKFLGELLRIVECKI